MTFFILPPFLRLLRIFISPLRGRGIYINFSKFEGGGIVGTNFVARKKDCEAAVNSPTAFSGRRLTLGKTFFEVARGDLKKRFHVGFAEGELTAASPSAL
jgi:hypothetical protein